MLAVLVGALFAVGLTGLSGLADLDGQVESLYCDHIVTLQRTTQLAADSAKAHKLALEIIASNSKTDIRQLEAQLNMAMEPRTQRPQRTPRTAELDRRAGRCREARSRLLASGL